ncbi:hypothetical protein RM844_30015 [Streptomyces sp. DSM 44915]|uniref:Uncharacterized protein n=1 Tax=Streptomyces chisholmiae TaxID=3075540 RepID=A0ABU2K0I8_9ACTN|nr:hypothetical protein [Streptomyces sp. DSM 44915]MDT0270516.1 hypothetical protein [Streptomyces sp. DSM 44915]
MAATIGQLALPPPASAAGVDESWRLRSLHVERPDRVRLRAGAFRAPGRPVVAGRPADPRGFALRGAEVTTGR